MDFALLKRAVYKLASVLVFSKNFTSETSSFSKRKPSISAEYITQIFTNKYRLITVNFYFGNKTDE